MLIERGKKVEEMRGIKKKKIEWRIEIGEEGKKEVRENKKRIVKKDLREGNKENVFVFRKIEKWKEEIEVIEGGIIKEDDSELIGKS